MRAGGGVDASAVLALLSEDRHGDWVADTIRAHPLAAPHLVMFEAANVLRRWMTSGRLPQEIVALAHDDLLALPLELWLYVLLAEQVQRLAGSVTAAHDASYVALADLLDLPLVTLDRRLAHAPGIRCRVLTPP